MDILGISLLILFLLLIFIFQILDWYERFWET